jgi:hypothetical protein
VTLYRTLPVPVNLVAPSKYTMNTSEWWIERLSRALSARLKRFELLDAYYRGTQNVARLASEEYQASGMQALFPGLNANHSKLIVNAAGQRLVILGFRLGGELRADTEAARIWRANEMDALSDAAHTESLVKGECPVLVEPNPQDESTPIITPQDPSQTIVWHAAGDRRIRLAALKTWWDDAARRRYYILYRPDVIEYWQDRDPGQLDSLMYGLWGNEPPRWERRGADWKTTNPLGVVPMVVLPNDPRLTGSPEGEHEPALPLIDLYNFTLMNMAHTARELAFPQRWATGVEVDEGEPEIDPDTGEVLSEPPSRVKSAPNQMLTVPTPEAQFGQFAAATLDGYIKALDTFRADEATITFTPYHFLLNMPTSVPPSGESIVAAEAALVDKVRGHARDKGAGWREIMHLAFRLAGDERRAAAMRESGVVIWRDPQSRTESQHVDALSKLAAPPISVPQEAIWEQIPVPPEEIERWRKMREEEAAKAPQPPTALIVPNGQPAVATVPAVPTNGGLVSLGD